MSFSITYTELVGIAIPQCGVVNFKALHLLLQGILDHIHIADTAKTLSGDEDFLQSSQVIIVPREGDAQPIVNPMKRLGNIFDNVIDRLNNIESKITVIQDMPTTSELLEASFGANRPAEEMWNIIKLQKKIEGNEETMAKFMKTLQDLFTDFHTIKKNVETLRKDVDVIKYIFDKVNPERMDLVCEDLKAQNRKLAALQREVVPLQEKVRALPHPEEIVLWGTLHEAMFTQEAPKLELDMWRSTTSFPESSLRQFEDGSLKTMADSGVLGKDEYIRASGSQAQYGPLFAFGPRSGQEPAKRIGKPGSRPVQWAKPKPAAPGALPLLPRGTPEESGGPVWDMGAFQPSLGPEGQIDRAAFPAMEVGPSRPQPLPQQEVPQTETHRLSDHEEKGNEYDDDYMRDSQEEVPKDETSQDGSPKGRAPRGGIAKKGASRDGSPKEGSPRDGIAKEGASRGGMAKKGASQDGSPKEGSSRDGSPKEGAPQDDIAKEKVPQDRIAKEGAPRDGSFKEGAPQGGVAKKGAPWDKSPKEGAPQDGIPKEGAPRDGISKEGDKAPQHRAPIDKAPQHGVSRDGIPQDRVTKDEAPKARALKDMLYKYKAQKDKTPEERPKSPSSNVNRLRSALAAAAATAAAYAAAANTAVQAAKAAAKSIKDVPESKMSVKAVHEAASGPLGTIADLLSAGTSYGAASVIPFNDEELEDFLEEFASVFPHSTSKSSLSQAMLRAKQAVSPEEKKRAVQYSMSYIAQMPVKHDSLKEEFVQMSTSMNQRLNYLAKMGSFGKLGSTVSVLEDKIIGLQKARLQEEELERIWGHQIESMKNHYMVLDRTVERLQLSVDNLKNLKTDIERLDLTKADKNMLYDELKEKADKDNLASKANRSDLETVALELNGLVQSMLLKITSQEDDWKKSLKHLRRDLNTKLVHSDLNSLKKDIEEVWMVVRKLLLEGLRFDPDSAAGFKKKLFERVKCISCDRPVEMMTGPQLITIRNAPGLSRMRPASANSFDYLQRQLMREQQQQLHFQNFGVREELGLQKDWGDGPRNETTFKHKSHELSTLYPYGDPELIDYDSAEVDILGVDGVLYKGRMSSQFGARIGEKDLSAVKVSCPLVQNMNDRVRPGSLLAPSYPPLGLRNNMTSATSLHSATTLARPPSLPPLPQLPPLIPVSRDIQEGTGSTKHLKPLRLEHTNP
nr:uncharacterized protein C16orf96 homolog [Meriones unguiculatus]